MKTRPIDFCHFSGMLIFANRLLNASYKGFDARATPMLTIKKITASISPHVAICIFSATETNGIRNIACVANNSIEMEPKYEKNVPMHVIF